MNRLYRYIAIVFAALACYSAAGQNLDPTVVVDRAYEGKLMEVHKPALEMAVPDTVTRFDLDFDYSVFENPYRETYEFNPYLLTMKPSAATEAPGRLYLNVGAGYQLHPELDLVWSPNFPKADEGFSMDVYARHRSFFGKYWGLQVSDDLLVGRSDDSYKGGNMESKAGVNMKYDWVQGSIDFDLAYYGIHQGYKADEFHDFRSYNAVDASFHVGSKAHAPGLIYGLSGYFRYADESITRRGNLPDRSTGEINFKTDGLIGVLARGADEALVRFGVDVAGYKRDVEGAASVLYIAPHYVLNRGALKADIGVKVMGSIVDTVAGTFLKNAKDQIVYPDVNVSYSIMPERLVAYFKADGGSHLNSYSSLLKRNRHAVIGIGNNLVGYDMGVSVERVSLSAGFEGRFGKRLTWNLAGGYANYASGILDSVLSLVFPGYNPSFLLDGVEYGKYQKGFATFSAYWNNERFAADGTVTYTGAWGDVFEKSISALKPAAVTGDVSFEYNYSKRIYAGVNCSFATARTGGLGSLTLPGYADLGVSAEYVTSRNLSFWVKGGNLLGMTVMRDILYAQKGPYFTLGICLNL